MTVTMRKSLTRRRYRLYVACFLVYCKLVLSFSIENRRFIVTKSLEAALTRTQLPTCWSKSINNNGHRSRQFSIQVHRACQLYGVASIEENDDNYQSNIIYDLSTKEPKRPDKNVGGYDPSERLGGREVNVGDPQLKLQEKEFSVTAILRELKAIQQKGPQKYCILGTRHCSYMHQQIIELL
jgi:hypothetical protein